MLLHIGPQKTGSPAIAGNRRSTQARARLAENGVQYVGDRAHEKEAGVVALGLRGPIGRPPPRPETWQRVVDEIAGATLPRLCLSNEDFSRADDDAVARILDATGAARTHLVYVARRLDKVLPSHWQQQVKARLTASYSDFLRRVLDPGAHTWTSTLVMEPQDVGAVLARWGKHIPPERMTVVVADEDDRTALPRAFESLLGVPVGVLEPPRGPANRSLGLAATDAVRRVNQVAIDEEWSPAEYRNLVQLGVVPALKDRATTDGPKLTGVPAWAFDRVADLAAAQVEAIASSGAQVIGDPAQLLIRDRVAPVDVPPEVTAVDLDLLADVVSGVRAGAARMRPAGGQVDVKRLRDDLGGRQLLQLLARRTAARLAFRSR